MDLIPGATSVPSPGRLVILVVDDHSWIRRMVSIALGGTYNVMTATDGREALRLLEMIKVDLIITDLIMPDIGGLALAWQARVHYPDIPIAFVSAHIDGDTVKQARELSPFYITKPFGIEELQVKVRRILEAAGKPV